MAKSSDRILLTGASGTLGSQVLSTLRTKTLFALTTVGRRTPMGMRPKDVHLAVNFGEPQSVDQIAQQLDHEESSFRAAVFMAGIDSRQGSRSLQAAAFVKAMQVNCLAHLQILRQLVTSRSGPRSPLQVIAVSSDVVNSSQKATAVYAASKAALEEGLRHATSESCLRVVLVRLPALGTAMKEVAEGVSTFRGDEVMRPLGAGLADRIAVSLKEDLHRLPVMEVWQ